MTFFGYLGSKIPQSFGTQIYLYPIMQVLGGEVHKYVLYSTYNVADTDTLKMDNSGLMNQQTNESTSKLLVEVGAPPKNNRNLSLMLWLSLEAPISSLQTKGDPQQAKKK